jgi:glycogen(starch) synthase
MRALILSWEYPPVIEGGLARHVRKLSEALVALGIQVHVLTRGDGAGPSQEVCQGVTVHRVCESPRPSDLNRFVAWVERMNADMLAAGVELGDSYRPDIVAGHDWLVAVACEHLSARFECPLVMTVHATEYGRHQGYVSDHPQSWIHGIERRMAARADRVIACSHYMQGHVADVFAVPEGRITVIPNGIDPIDMRPVEDLSALRARFAQPEEQLVLLVGRLVYEKGFQLALEALAPIVKQRASVRFLVAGSGTHEDELKLQARRLGLTDHGEFLGWIGDDVLHSLYRIADLCVVPSLFEPFGLVALEAMASGCACIVADTGGLREVVPAGERVGLRFNGGDADHLGVMIDRLLSDTQLRDRLVIEASEHVLRFDWNDVAQRTLAVYREQVSQGRGAGDGGLAKGVAARARGHAFGDTPTRELT